MNNKLFNVLSKSQLQLIAAAAMLIDHTAIFAYYYISPFLYYFMRFIGRITIVIMCYFIVEGYHKTHDLNRYLVRMGVFAAVSQIPFYVSGNYSVPSNLYTFIAGNFYSRNVIFTLFAGLALITIIRSSYSSILKILSCIAILFLTRNSDWGIYAIMWIVCFEIFYGDTKKQLTWAAFVLLIRLIFVGKSVISGCIDAGYMTVEDVLQLLTQLGGFLSLPLLLLYNHKKGKASKFSFYIFYPVHLLILAFFKMLLFS